MIDSIRLFIRREELPEDYDKFFLEKIRSWDESKERTYSGNLKNINFRIFKYGLRIEGSLTKYIHGHNLCSTSLGEINKAVKEIEEEMKIDIMSAKVIRLDIGENLVMKYPVKEYYQIFSRARYLERRPYKNGVYFDNGTRTLAFYNKISELRSKKVFVEGWLKSQKVLRFEYRYKGNHGLSKFLKVKNATLNDVLNQYGELVDSWRESYFSIIKENEPIMFNDEVFEIKGGFDRQLKVLGVLMLGGIQGLDKLVDIAKARGYFKKYPNEATNIRAKVKDLMNTPNMTQKSNLISELNGKISLVNCYNHDKSEFYQIE